MVPESVFSASIIFAQDVLMVVNVNIGVTTVDVLIVLLRYTNRALVYFTSVVFVGHTFWPVHATDIDIINQVFAASTFRRP